MTEGTTPSAVGVLGTGTWGTALARMLAVNGHAVTAWSPIKEEIEQLRATGKHPNLPEVDIPSSIHFTNNIEEACRDKEVLLFAVPSVFVRSTARLASPILKLGRSSPMWPRALRRTAFIASAR